MHYLRNPIRICRKIRVVYFHQALDLGRGYTNYDIQIIVEILKGTTRFFQQRPWIIVKIIMIVFGSHMPNMNYEVYCGSASVELTE